MIPWNIQGESRLETLVGFHLSFYTHPTSMLTFKMFEILLPLIKIRVKIGVLGLGTFHLCLNKSKNDETNFKMFEI